MEDMAEKWLEKNDPLYSKTKKRRKLKHPYITKKQLFYRSRIEIPVSSLDTYVAQEWTDMDEEQLKEVQGLFT